MNKLERLPFARLFSQSNIFVFGKELRSVAQLGYAPAFLAKKSTNTLAYLPGAPVREAKKGLEE
jgi:hypothetical protein